MVHGAGAGRGPARFGKEKYKRARSTRVLLSYLWSYIKKYVWEIFLVVVISILYSALTVVNPLIIGEGLNGLDVSNISSFSAYTMIIREGYNASYVTDLSSFSVYTTLIILVIVFLVITAIGWVISSFSTRIMANMNSKMLHEVRSDLYTKLSYSDMAYLKNEQSGNITARVTADTGELAVGLQMFTSIVSQLLLIIASFVMLMITSWIIGLMTLGALPSIFIMAGGLSFFARKIVLRVRRAFGIVSGKMAEGLEGIAVAKSFNREEELATELRELNHQHYKYSRQFGMLMMFVFPSMTALGYGVFIVVILASGWINMSAFFSIGDIFKVLQLSQSFLFPMVMLSMMFPQLESALGAMDRVIDIFEAKPAVADVEDAEDLQIEDDTVNFNKVSFAYEANEYVLTNVSFSAKPGEMIAVVGHTGAGKTTLFSSLLTRFYDVNNGSISIGDQDIRSVKQSSLRQAIGLVTQEPFLFTGSVMENILYGAPNATEEDVYDISKRINADEFIEALPQGYDNQVVEGGKKLSAGQRQIITVARTMLADPRILVLDEATSRLDAYTESLVQAAQRELFKGRTTFVIAHRLSTIKDADRIVVLDQGELKELGNHNELMEKEGIYADLYNTYYVHQGLADIMIKPEDLGIETLDQDIQTKKGNAHKMAMGQKHGGMKGKKPSKREMKKMKKEKDGVSPMEQQSSKGLTPEMIENLKERAKGLNPEDIKAMMKKMKKLTGEDFPEELKKMLLQISEKHKNKR